MASSAAPSTSSKNVLLNRTFPTRRRRPTEHAPPHPPAQEFAIGRLAAVVEGAHLGGAPRLLLVDTRVDGEEALPTNALGSVGSVHVVEFNAEDVTRAGLIALVREAHKQTDTPFLAIAVAPQAARRLQARGVAGVGALAGQRQRKRRAPPHTAAARASPRATGCRRPWSHKETTPV